MSQANLNDYVSNFVRTPLATAQGSTIPFPYGGAPRLINVDLDLARLYAKGLSPADVSAAINAENVILPAGSARLGSREYSVRLNSSPEVVEQLNDMPIKEVNGAIVYIRDVAYVRDGAGVQTNIVRQNGQHGTYMSVLKNGSASSLAVVNRVKALLAALKPALPPSLDIQLLVDQSLFVRAAISGVIREALIAACLTALMILLFLGSWRSTLIIATSIPLAVLCSIIGLAALGQTLNVMTLSGLALAVGILVDDATVTIENINLNMERGKEILPAIVDGAAQIATPAFVSTIAISIVFVPMFFLTGPAAALFRPLAMAVVFAVLASYVLSRTIVPTMAHYLLAADAHRLGAGRAAARGLIERVSARFGAAFERFRAAYQGALGWALGRRRLVLGAVGGFAALSLVLVPFIGEDFFPTTDAGAFQLHLRAPPGMRVEETELIAAGVERTIRRVIPPAELGLILDNIGINRNAINPAPGGTATLNAADADLVVQLAATRQTSTFEYVRRLRATLPTEFPGVTFFFLPADIEPGAQPWPAGADRRPGRGAGQDGRLRRRHPPGRGSAAHPRRRRRPGAAGGEHAGVSVHRGPHPGAAGRSHPAPGGEQSAHLALLERADRAQLLAQPAERRELQRGCAHAAVQNQRAGRADQHAGHGAGTRRAAAVRESGDVDPPDHVRRCEPLQHATGVRRLCGGGRPGPGRRGERCGPGRRQDRSVLAEGRAHRGAWPGREHAVVVRGARVGGAVRDGARVPAARHQLSVVARSPGDRDGAARRAVRHRVDAVRDPDHLQCPLIDGEHHGPGRRHRQQRPAHHVRG